jgi:hypothetical protein
MESWSGGINEGPDRSILSESESDSRMESSDRKPWGFWWTLLFAGVIAAAYACVQLVVAFAFVAVAKHRAPGDLGSSLARLEFNGLYLSIAVLSSTVVCGSLILLFVRFQRRTSVSQYLHLMPVPPVTLAKWSLAILVYAAACDATNVLLGRPVVPAFMTESYRTAGLLPLFWLAIIVAAPLFESFSSVVLSSPGGPRPG